MLHVWYIYLHDWLIFRANVGKYTRKYTSTLEHMGYCITTVIAHPDFWWDTDPKIGFRTCARKGLERDAPLLGTVSDKNVLYSENICHTIEHVAKALKAILPIRFSQSDHVNQTIWKSDKGGSVTTSTSKRNSPQWPRNQTNSKQPTSEDTNVDQCWLLTITSIGCHWYEWTAFVSKMMHGYDWTAALHMLF